ncbi:ComEC/Rec2 family competence protein [Desulfurobacterium indicum]|uniref:ComEC/Rec2 family competence protein n=1 Tax=Desulfurobacterium indicum TaxID=1914305 RepID=UPI0013011528|nr:ComEC/Rec2 family competence protein [Desulfurobacterium indicum]
MPFLAVVFLLYLVKYGIRDLVFSALIVVLLVSLLSVFSSSSISEVKWIFETDEGRVALLTDGRYVSVSDDVSVGDVVSDDGMLVEKGGLLSLPDRVRFALSEKVESSIDYPFSSLVEAVTLGVRYNLPQSVKAYMALAGVYPFLAISGLHVAVIFGFISVVMKLFRIFSLKRALFILTVLMPFTGFPVSVIRAYIFIVIAVFLKIHGRRVDYIYITVLTAFLMSLIFSVSSGFILSFLGALGIFAAMETDGFKRKLFLILFPFFFTLPYVVFRFGTVNLFSPLFMVLLTPLFTLFLFLCFLSEITYFKLNLFVVATEKVSGYLILFIKWLFGILHFGIIHVYLSLFEIFVLTFLVFVVLILKINRSYLLVVFSIFTVLLLFNRSYVYNETKRISGRKLNSAYFLSGEGQKYKDSTLVTDYVFPYSRRILKFNGVAVKQSVK